MGQVPRELQAVAHLSTLLVGLHAEVCDFSLQSAPLPTLTSISQRGQQLLQLQPQQLQAGSPQQTSTIPMQNI